MEIKISCLSLLLAGLCSLAHAAPPEVVTSGRAEIEVLGDFQVDSFKPGAKIFLNRDFVVAECPDSLAGVPFLRSSIDSSRFRVVRDGELTVLTPESAQYKSAQYEALESRGFVRVAEPALFQLFGDVPSDKVRTYRKEVKAGEKYSFGKWTVVMGFASAKKPEPQVWNKNAGELLYNGIRLPETWPPQDIDPASRQPMAVPYLDHPPGVIPIDVGRQLFVDDFLIEKTNLTRAFHYPEKYTGNPVLKAETPVELGQVEPEGHKKPYGHGNVGAVPKSGGCWWDPEDQVFKLWYETSWFGPIAMAVSKDGIHWDRPALDVVPGTNFVLPLGTRPPDSWTVVRDWDTKNPKEKYKMFVREPGGEAIRAMCLVSPDGIHWSEPVMSGVMGDRSTMFYNPFRKKWVYSLRSAFRDRSRHYWEGDDFMKDNQWDDFALDGQDWKPGQPVFWAASDELDLADAYIKDVPQLYNLDAVAYESIMLGFFQILVGPDNNKCKAAGIPKLTDLNFAYSRDGFHWHRPDRTMAIPSERKAGAWDRGYVQSLGNICVVQGDKIWIYYAGYAGDESKAGADGLYDNAAMGVAFLRRDGFVSMDAGEKPGTLTTRPVTFPGQRLFVNLDAPEGMLRVEVLDKQGNPIEPFTMAKSIPVRGDSTLEAVSWEGGADLSALAGQPVRFRFELTNGSLYAFWVSKDDTGRSDGYVAGGGPGYTGATDTVGRGALTIPSIPPVGLREKKEKPLDVYILAGQSNMVGMRSEIEKVPADWMQPDYGILFFDNGNWIPAIPGKTEPKGFGPEISFGQTLRKLGHPPLGIIKASRGATALAEHWNAGPEKGELLKFLENQIRSAKMSRPLKFRGIIWMQGESDADSPAKAQAYAENLTAFISAVREIVGDDALPFYCGRVNPPADKFPEVETVRRSQETCPAENYFLINCDDLQKVPDNLHYNTEGILEAGKRFAEAVARQSPELLSQDLRDNSQ